MGYITTEQSLGNTTTYTSGTQMRNTFDAVKGIVFSDTAGALHIDQGFRAANGTVFWDFDTSVPVVASTGKEFNVELYAPLWRIRYVQAGNQTVFRLHATTTAVGYAGG
jgi:hypothetical protein